MDSSGVNGSDTRDHARDVQGSTTASSPAFDALSNPALDAAAFDTPAAQRAVADAVATRTPIAQSGPVCYALQPGQTLQDVATAFGTTVRELALANGITNPETVQPGQVLSVPPPQDKPAMGSLSEQYETGGRGPGTVSNGRGDRGGVSYGSYQLATNAGTPQEFLGAEGARWAGEFAGQRPGTPAFSQTWRDIAAREPGAFQQAQHDYIERTHYDVQAASVQTRTAVAGVDGGIASPGLDLAQHSRALQNVAWSTAVQHGPRSRIVAEAIAGVRTAGIQDWAPDFDRAVIDAVYAERGRVDRNGTLVHFSGSRADVQAGVAARFVSERADAVAALEAEDRALREALGQ